MCMGSGWGGGTGRTRYSMQPFLVLKGGCILSLLNSCGTWNKCLLSLISCVHLRPSLDLFIFYYSDLLG